MFHCISNVLISILHDYYWSLYLLYLSSSFGFGLVILMVVSLSFASALFNFDSSKISHLILCRYVSRVPLSVSLLGFSVSYGFCWKGSRALGVFFICFSFQTSISFYA